MRLEKQPIQNKAMEVFYNTRGQKCHIVCEFDDLGYTMVVFRVWIKHKGYFTHEIEYKKIIIDGMGKYFFKSKYLYKKWLEK